MDRRIITTDDGQLDGWFDADKATFRQDVGDNNDLTVGRVYLYRTAGGVYVLNHWDHYAGSRETYTRATSQQVAEWAITYDEIDGFEYPDEIKKTIADLEA